MEEISSTSINRGAACNKNILLKKPTARVQNATFCTLPGVTLQFDII